MTAHFPQASRAAPIPVGAADRSAAEGGARNLRADDGEGRQLPAHGGTVLVADDDEFFRMALSVILTEQLGFDAVIEAGSMDDAVEILAERGDIALALFDLDMPGMKSAASLRAVRQSFDSLKVAVVSGSRRREDILLALSSGVHGFVLKGSGATSIRRALSLVMEGLIFVPHSITDLAAEEADPAAAQSQPVSRDQLTQRQVEVLELLVEGRSNKEIARRLGIGEGTVKVHMSALFRVLGTHSRSAAAVMGVTLLAG